MKDKIIETALDRFLHYGIRNITILKLVEPLGISTKTVYKYFSGKEELLAECLNLLYTGYYYELNLILNSKENTVNKLLILFRSSFGRDFGTSHAFFHDLNYYYPELQNKAINRVANSYGTLILPLIARGIDEGYFNSFIKAEIALDGVATLYTAITRSEKYRGYSNPYELFRNLVEVYVRGMCTPKGLEEIDNNPYHND